MFEDRFRDGYQLQIRRSLEELSIRVRKDDTPHLEWSDQCLQESQTAGTELKAPLLAPCQTGKSTLAYGSMCSTLYMMGLVSR